MVIGINPMTICFLGVDCGLTRGKTLQRMGAIF